MVLAKIGMHHAPLMGYVNVGPFAIAQPAWLWIGEEEALHVDSIPGVSTTSYKSALPAL